MVELIMTVRARLFLKPFKNKSNREKNIYGSLTSWRFTGTIIKQKSKSKNQDGFYCPEEKFARRDFTCIISIITTADSRRYNDLEGLQQNSEDGLINETFNSSNSYIG